jgi:hypothetical protein
VGRLLAEGRSVTKHIVVSGLIEKRRELAGVIDQMQRQLDQRRADLTHIDGVLRILAADLDPETIRPKRAYRRNRYFARNELSRLCLGALRTAAGELLSTDDIAARVIAAKGFDAADGILRTAIRDQVGSTVKRLHRDGTIENIGAARQQMEAGRRLAGHASTRLDQRRAIREVRSLGDCGVCFTGPGRAVAWSRARISAI